MSPDWSGAPSGVPYAAFRNPQSLNLYAYVGNDPINGEDADGHISANMTAISFASGAFATAELALDEEELEFAPAGNVAASSDTTGSSSASGTANAQATNSNIQTTPASAPPAGQQNNASSNGLTPAQLQNIKKAAMSLAAKDAKTFAKGIPGFSLIWSDLSTSAHRWVCFCRCRCLCRPSRTERAAVGAGLSDD